MANKTSLIITSTDTGGKTFNKTLTDINPAASTASLRAFAQGLNGLTTNTYNGAAIVTRTEIPTDATDPCFTVTPTVISKRALYNGDMTVHGSFNYDGFPRTPTLSGKKLSYISITVGNFGFVVKKTEEGYYMDGDVDCVFTLTLPAQSPYAAKSVDVTIPNCDPQYIVDIE